MPGEIVKDCQDCGEGRRPRRDPDLFLSLKKFRMFMYKIGFTKNDTK